MLRERRGGAARVRRDEDPRALAQAHSRAHSKAGAKRYVIVLRENRLLEAMLLSGLTTEAELSEYPLAEAALSRLIFEWMARWLK